MCVNRKILYSIIVEGLDGPGVFAVRRTIVEIKQRWSAIGWVIKN
jgi:hypothetical protein